jgi:peptidoglycan hydrolase CwlO-like protein
VGGMKKLVLLMVSALVLTIFISFNYLLWFRGEQITDYQDRIKKIEEQQAMKENIANSNNNYYLGQILEKNREIEYLNKEIERLKSDSNRLEQELQLGTTD